jgi:hypothetical protein
MAMQPKSIVFLAAALVVGFALGLFVDARVLRIRRDRRVATLRTSPSPFTTRIENAVHPHSGGQRDSLDVVLNRLLVDNTTALQATIQRNRAHTDSLRVVLSPMLDSAQRTRLDSVLKVTNRGVTMRGMVRDGPPRTPPSR